jgi:hypothetical protein
MKNIGESSLILFEIKLMLVIIKFLNLLFPKFS